MSATTAALPGEIRVRQEAMREAKQALVRKLRKVFCEVIVDQETWERHLPGIKYLTE